MQAVRTTLLAVSVLLLAVPAAQADRKVQRPMRPPLPQPVPAVIVGACPGLTEAAGCYLGVNEADNTGAVYARGAAFVASRYRFSILHEFGHAYDATMMDASERNRFAHLVDMDLYLWTWSDVDDQGRVTQAVGTPAELFADAYATCRMGLVVASRHVWLTSYGYYPSARQHRRICKAIARAGADPGTPVAPDGSR